MNDLTDESEDDFDAIKTWLHSKKLSIDDIVKYMMMTEELNYDKIKLLGNQIIADNLEKQSKCLVHKLYHVDKNIVICRDCKIEYQCDKCAYKCNKKYKGCPIEVIKKCQCGNTIFNFACNRCKSTSCFCGCKKACICYF